MSPEFSRAILWKMTTSSALVFARTLLSSNGLSSRRTRTLPPNNSAVWMSDDVLLLARHRAFFGSNLRVIGRTFKCG